MEFNYIRACLPAPFLPVSLFLPVAPWFTLSPLLSLFPLPFLPFPSSLVRLAFPFSSITSSAARCYPFVARWVKTHREVFTLEWKYLNFAASSSGNYCSRRLVRLQLRTHFSSAILPVIPARITSIPCRLPTLPRCLQRQRIFKCHHDYILPPGLSRASSSGGESLSLFSFS